MTLAVVIVYGVQVCPLLRFRLGTLHRSSVPSQSAGPPIPLFEARQPRLRLVHGEDLFDVDAVDAMYADTRSLPSACARYAVSSGDLLFVGYALSARCAAVGHPRANTLSGRCLRYPHTGTSAGQGDKLPWYVFFPPYE